MFCFSTFAKTLKRYAKNVAVTDEKFVDEILAPYAEAIGVITPRGKDFYFDKSRASELINGKRDIPRKFRNGLSRYGLKEAMEPGIEAFIEESLSASRRDALQNEIIDLIAGSGNISEESKQALLKQGLDLVSLISECLLLSIELPNVVDEKEPLFKNGKYSVDVIIDDLFKYGFKKRSKQKRIIVIPVNTQFSMELDEELEGCSKPLVASSTVHGQLLKKWVQSGRMLEELANRVSADLTFRHGNRNERSIGDIAVVEENSAVLYLLAISTFDNDNNAHSDKAGIEKALNSLVDFYDINGQGYDLYMPIMGTGRSRANISLQGAYDLVCEVINNRLCDIHGNVHIVILPGDANQINLIRKDPE